MTMWSKFYRMLDIWLGGLYGLILTPIVIGLAVLWFLGLM